MKKMDKIVKKQRRYYKRNIVKKRQYKKGENTKGKE